ncbi:MAG: cyclin family protein [bacterium]|nr:cyclin family protein [bacterium]
MEIVALALHKLALKGNTASQNRTKFHAIEIPGISIRDYLKRFVTFLNLECAHLIAILIIQDRYIKKLATNSISYTNIHRLLAAITQAVHKTYDDELYSNTYYASIAGIPVKEMNVLEVELLFVINFELFITPETYLLYRQEIVNFAAREEERHYGMKHYAINMSQQDKDMLNLLKEDPFHHPTGCMELPGEFFIQDVVAPPPVKQLLIEEEVKIIPAPEPILVNDSEHIDPKPIPEAPLLIAKNEAEERKSIVFSNNPHILFAPPKSTHSQKASTCRFCTIL